VNDTKDINEYLHGIVTQVIDKKREEKQSQDVISKDKKDWDVLDRLLVGGEEEEAVFSDKEIRDEVIGFFLAGHETTANTMTILALEICRHPQVYEKLQAEIDEAQLEDGTLTLESLSAFKYLDMVIKESMRLHPVASQLGRIALKDFDYGQYHFREGNRVVISIRALHRNPKYWSDPLEFKPERWTNFTPVSGSYMPFGDGPSNCKLN
jgi:cytochrome P450